MPMTLSAEDADHASSLRRWLLAPEPQGWFQASAQQFHHGWLKFRLHPLGLAGLAHHRPADPGRARCAMADALRSDRPGYGRAARTAFGRTLARHRQFWPRCLFKGDLWCAHDALHHYAGFRHRRSAGSSDRHRSGYFGGIVDEVLMRITDIFLSFPGLVLALGFAAALGPGITNAIIAISLTAWPPIARLARAEDAQPAQGRFHRRRASARGDANGDHHPPHPADVHSLGDRSRDPEYGRTIIITGGRPRVPRSWRAAALAGMEAMAATGREFMLDSPWVIAAPGIAIALVSLAFNLVGDALRDVLDPRGSE